VKRRGDRALLQYARRFDGLREPLEVSRDEIEEGAARVPPAVRAALAAAARNIRKVARRQRPGHWTLTRSIALDAMCQAGAIRSHRHCS
jgi:histidinol dehydrogenase